MGRTGDRTWTHGQRDSTLRDHKLNNKVDTKKGSPSADEVRDCLKEGYCWWCNRGGWKALSIHTCSQHGISADDLREMAGLYKHIPTCVEDLSLRFRNRNLTQLKEGLRTLPKGKSGYHIKFSTAGRKYQDEVRSVILLANSGDEQRLKARNQAKILLSKPHHCPICGKMIPRATPITCSPECRRVISRRNILKAIPFANSPEARKKCSDTMKSQLNDGTRKLLKPRKPHPCIICGKIIPKAHPYACSPKCLYIARQNAQKTAIANRHLKIRKEDYVNITRRYGNGESSEKIAKEYNVSRAFITLIAKRKLKTIHQKVSHND